MGASQWLIVLDEFFYVKKLRFGEVARLHPERPPNNKVAEPGLPTFSFSFKVEVGKAMWDQGRGRRKGREREKERREQDKKCVK